MKIILADIADIRLGHPFRGTIKADDEGDVFVVQPRNTSEDGEINAQQLTTTTLTGRKTPDWLQHGDILFVAKGAKHYAVCVDNHSLPARTVCSPHFFLVRIKAQHASSVVPAFIAWQLNQQLAQRYFINCAEGSLYVSIRKQVLEETPLQLPSLKRQKQLAQLYLTTLREKKCLQRLIDNRQQQLSTIAMQEFSD